MQVRDLVRGFTASFSLLNAFTGKPNTPERNPTCSKPIYLKPKFSHESNPDSARPTPNQRFQKPGQALPVKRKGNSRTWKAVEKLLYSITDACTILGISRSTLYRLIDQGEIEVTRIRSLPRFTEKSLKSFTETCQKSSREKAVGF